MNAPPVTCQDLAREAQELLSQGHGSAARLLYNRVAETCLHSRHHCIRHDTCRVAVEQLGRQLQEPPVESRL
jgi:hypothetical protein